MRLITQPPRVRVRKNASLASLLAEAKRMERTWGARFIELSKKWRDLDFGVMGRDRMQRDMDEAFRECTSWKTMSEGLARHVKGSD